MYQKLFYHTEFKYQHYYQKKVLPLLDISFRIFFIHTYICTENSPNNFGTCMTLEKLVQIWPSSQSVMCSIYHFIFDLYETYSTINTFAEILYFHMYLFYKQLSIILILNSQVANFNNFSLQTF